MSSRMIRRLILRNTHVLTAAGDYTIPATHSGVVVLKDSGAATGITLPAPQYVGHCVLVKDGKGDAATNNITITPTGVYTIDSAATYVISENYGAVLLEWNGTEWGAVATYGSVSAAELAYLNGVTAGTAAANKAVVLGASGEIATITSATITTVTTGAIAGADSSLGITGQAAAQGGDVAVTGGTSSTAANAGGAITITGGTAGANAAGGAVTIAGAAGGATTGAGGAVTVRGGAATAGNSSGADVTIRGGAKNGTGSDGNVVIGDANTTTITLGKMARIPVATVVVGGTAIGNANAVTEGFTLVTGADNSAAVKLPEAVAGARATIKNSDAANILILFPAVNDTINGGSANAAVNIPAAATRSFVALNAVAWFGEPETIA